MEHSQQAPTTLFVLKWKLSAANESALYATFSSSILVLSQHHSVTHVPLTITLSLFKNMLKSTFRWTPSIELIMVILLCYMKIFDWHKQEVESLIKCSSKSSSSIDFPAPGQVKRLVVMQNPLLHSMCHSCHDPATRYVSKATLQNHVFTC